MSLELNDVLETIPEDEVIAPTPKAKKPKKPKKEISPERKAALLEQLKKARTKAAENRAAKKAAKEAGLPPPPKAEKAKRKPRAKKVKTAVAEDTEDETPPPPVAAPKVIDGRDAELIRLRAQVANYTLQDIARNSKPQPKRRAPRVPKLKEDETLQLKSEPEPEPEPEIEVPEPEIEVKPETPTPSGIGEVKEIESKKNEIAPKINVNKSTRPDGRILPPKKIKKNLLKSGKKRRR